jgi:hypothetical protein
VFKFLSDILRSAALGETSYLFDSPVSKCTHSPEALLLRNTQPEEKTLFDRRAERHSITYSEREQSRALQQSCIDLLPVALWPWQTIPSAAVSVFAYRRTTCSESGGKGR